MSVYKCLLCGKPFGTIDVTDKPVCDNCKKTLVPDETPSEDIVKEKPRFYTSFDGTLKGFAVLLFVIDVIITFYIGSELNSLAAALACFCCGGFFSLLLYLGGEILSALKFIANN